MSVFLSIIKFSCVILTRVTSFEFCLYKSHKFKSNRNAIDLFSCKGVQKLAC